MQAGIFNVVTVIALLPVAMACLYYWFLAFYSISKKSDLVAREKKAVAVNSFAIVIPAHNEADVIAETLASCIELDYPIEKVQIFVIADNCTDDTARIVRKHGVTCYERYDNVEIGKGFALSWAFEQILPKGFDGILVIDADCTVEAHALHGFDQCFQNGDLVLQANDVASNPDASPMSYAVAVGNLIENDLFYAPKSALGLAVFLRGTGMVFHRDILLQYPWRAHSVVEDAEYTLTLLRHATTVKFIQNVKVSSAFPVTQKQLNIQRARWASGNLSFGKKQAVKLLLEGLCKRKPVLMDAGFTFLVLSRPLVLAELLLAIVVSYINWIIQSSTVAMFCYGLAICLVISLGAYFAMGVIRLGLTWRRLHLLLSSPFVVLQLVVIAINNFFEIKDRIWEKTPR